MTNQSNQVTLAKTPRGYYVEVEITAEYSETGTVLVQTVNGSTPFVIQPSKGCTVHTDWAYLPTSACAFVDGCTCKTGAGEACQFCKLTRFGYDMDADGNLIAPAMDELEV